MSRRYKFDTSQGIWWYNYHQESSRILKNHQESSSSIKWNTRSISYRAIRPYVAEDELTGRQMPRSKQLLGAAGSNVRPAFWRYHEKMSEEPQASRLEALVLAARLCFLRRSAFYILLYIYINVYLSRGQTMKCDFVFKLQDGQALPYQLPVVLFRHTGTDIHNSVELEFDRILCTMMTHAVFLRGLGASSKAWIHGADKSVWADAAPRLLFLRNRWLN